MYYVALTDTMCSRFSREAGGLPAAFKMTSGFQVVTSPSSGSRDDFSYSSRSNEPGGLLNDFQISGQW
jgi:hypothetical protein